MSSSMKRYGEQSYNGLQDYAVQPNSELIYHDNGLIEGTLSVRCEKTAPKSTLTGLLGSEHPSDPDVMLYALRRREEPLSIAAGTFDCIGTLKRRDTDRIVVPVPSIEMVPIEAHKNFFTTELAGDEGSIVELGAGSGYGEGANGARFTLSPNKKVTGFLGFIGPAAPAVLRALRVYQRNTPILRATWFTWSEPTFEFNCRIVDKPKGAPNFSGVKNWLRSAPVPERVGGAIGNVLWKIVQEYVGSETGWSTAVYGDVISETT